MIANAGIADRGASIAESAYFTGLSDMVTVANASAQ